MLMDINKLTAALVARKTVATPSVTASISAVREKLNPISASNILKGNAAGATPISPSLAVRLSGAAEVDATDSPTIIPHAAVGLVEDDFPFDDSQLEAIMGITRHQFACLTGAAGTGKTTCTKAIIKRLVTQSTSIVDLRGYWKISDPREHGEAVRDDDDDDDDEQQEESEVPSIALCAFTGRATEQIKKNFPEGWHSNIMTIHRLLAFYPVYYDEWNSEEGAFVKKMEFVPKYNEMNKLPWRVVVVDEAGMLGIDLWEQLLAACTEDTRIIMIGDINQLPPVHGRSVFGYAMANWPSWELTHIHRQKGKNNPIVDNAWRILQGEEPQVAENFGIVPLPETQGQASQYVKAIVDKVKNSGTYDPNRDTILTAINGERPEMNGYPLGQIPLNQSLVLMFNPDGERFLIDAGREIKNFAVGDKVMATKNDHQAGITNGMTGIIEEISENPQYIGNRTLVGKLTEVQQNQETFDLGDIDLDAIKINDDSIEAAKKKEEALRGMSSHTLAINFGSKTVRFTSKSEVGSIQLAYATTTHKAQGGEYPLVFIILHRSMEKMYYREWLYTAVTRAQHKVLIMASRTAMAAALQKQKIKGKNLAEKVQAFIDIQKALPGGKHATIPEPRHAK